MKNPMNTQHSDNRVRNNLSERFGIVDEGDIVDLTDLEAREEIIPAEAIDSVSSSYGNMRIDFSGAH